MIPPTSIDGTDITGATIDATDVQEITVDGDVVFTAGPTITVLDDFESGISGWSVQSGPASVSTTSVSSEGSFGLENAGSTAGNSSTVSGTYAIPTNKVFEIRFDVAWTGNTNFHDINFGRPDRTAGLLNRSGDIILRSGSSDITIKTLPNFNEYYEAVLRYDPINEEITKVTFDGTTITPNAPFWEVPTFDNIGTNMDDENESILIDNIRLATDF